MTAGRLAAGKPSATTNTVLYRCPTTVTGSAVLNVCNQSGSGASYRAALRNYDQVLHISGPQSYNGGAASPHKFAKGNPITAYKIKTNPGFQYASAIPGTAFTTTNAAKGKILDVYRPDDDVTYYAIVAPVSNTALEANTLAGTFTGGETVTGQTSGLTALFRGGTDTEMTLQFTDVTTAATTFNISRNTGLADGMYLTLGLADGSVGGEIVTIDVGGINTATNVLTVTRQALGTTAAAIPAGRACNAWSASATVTTIDEGATYVNGDITLTVADSTGFVSGGMALIDNEIVSIDDVNGNDLTVTRGRYGTADVDHNNGVNVTLLTDNGVYLANYFTEAESITGSSSNASATLNFSTTADAVITTKWLTTLNQGATDHILNSIVPVRKDVTYIFDLSDSSNTNYPLKFSSDAAEGTNQAPDPGTEYTQGVSKVGTAGTAGAYTSIAVNESTAINLFGYADGSPAGSTTGLGFNVQVNETPAFEEVFIYDVEGETLAAGDTFTVNNVTYTILQGGVTPGPFGYVQEYNATNCHLKIALGEGSAAFTAGTYIYDTPTLNNGDRSYVEVVDGKALTINTVSAADGSRTAGTYADIGFSSTTGSGTGMKFTVVVDGSGAATVTIRDGGRGNAVSDTIQINDSLLGSGGGAALTFNVATISSGVKTDQTEIYSDEDYLFYGKAIAANTTDKNSSIVVGPGENILVYSSAGDLSYVANGFESPSDDFPVVQMTKVVTSEDGGGAAP